MVGLIECQAHVEQLLDGPQLLVHGVVVNQAVDVVGEAVDFLLVEARERRVVSQLRQQCAQLLLVPAALDFVEGHVELPLLHGVKVYHRHVHLGLALVLEDGEPLVAAHHVIRPLIPYHRDKQPVGGNAAPEVFVLRVSGE